MISWLVRNGERKNENHITPRQIETKWISRTQREREHHPWLISFRKGHSQLHLQSYALIWVCAAWYRWGFWALFCDSCRRTSLDSSSPPRKTWKPGIWFVRRRRSTERTPTPFGRRRISKSAGRSTPPSRDVCRGRRERAPWRDRGSSLPPPAFPTPRPSRWSPAGRRPAGRRCRCSVRTVEIEWS